MIQEKKRKWEWGGGGGEPNWAEEQYLLLAQLMEENKRVFNGENQSWVHGTGEEQIGRHCPTKQCVIPLPSVTAADIIFLDIHKCMNVVDLYVLICWTVEGRSPLLTQAGLRQCCR